MKRSELRAMIREEYQKIIEAPESPRVQPEADPEQFNVSPPMEKQLSKIANLSQVKLFISKLPARPASVMADIIMSFIDIFDRKTNDPKSKLVTRELIVKLRDKLQN